MGNNDTDVRVISAASLLEERRKQNVEEPVPYRIGNEEREVVKRIVHGEMELLDLEEAVGELLTTPAGLDTVIQKSVLEIEQGRERTPLLYTPIYRRRENRRFSKFVEVPSSGRTRAVFLEHLEGEEIKFGSRTIGAKDVVPIITYATGFQWTEDMEEYDTTWEAEEANQAIGEAYNALLNHLHLYPIISYAYAAGNTTAWVAGATTYERDRATIKAALEKAALSKNAQTQRNRRPTIVLAHSSNQFRVTEALQRRQINGTIFEPLSNNINTVVLYDGWSETVGDDETVYAGTQTDRIYLIDPSRYFHELVKHDLLIDADNADLSRLIKEQIVARARRGVYAAPANGVDVAMLA